MRAAPHVASRQGSRWGGERTIVVICMMVQRL